jgi:hypothetical protein
MEQPPTCGDARTVLAEVERLLGPLVLRLASAVRRLEEAVSLQTTTALSAAGDAAHGPPSLASLLPDGALSVPLPPLRRPQADLARLEAKLLQVALQSADAVEASFCAPPPARGGDDSASPPPPPPPEEEDDDECAPPHHVPATQRHHSSRTAGGHGRLSGSSMDHLHAQLAHETLAGSFREEANVLKILSSASSASDGGSATTAARGAATRAVAARALQAAAERGTAAALRLAGVLPWDAERRPRASYVYQGAVSLGLLAAAGLHGRELAEGAASAVMAQALVLPVGAAAAVACCAAQQAAGSLGDLLAMLQAHARTRGYEGRARARAARDAWLAGGLGVLACAGHALGEAPPPAAALATASAATLLLAALAAAQIAVCHHLDGMVNHFCFRFAEEGARFDEAVREWNIVQAILRVACRASEGSFVVLQVSSLAVVISVGIDAASNGLLRPPALPWGALLTVLLAARLLAAATGVTSTCQRVPAFVNSLRPDLALDPSRLYLVHYVVHSQAGFCTYGVRLHAALVLRLFYATCALAFGAAAKLLAHGQR